MEVVIFSKFNVLVVLFVDGNSYVPLKNKISREGNRIIPRAILIRLKEEKLNLLAFQQGYHKKMLQEK